MAYLPDWERLFDALKRLRATGLAEGEAKRQICNAIADRNIKLRIYLLVPPINVDWLPRRALSAREAYHVKDDEIPPRLTPRDFNWSQSRVRRSGPWQKVRGPSGSFLGHWKVVDMSHHRPDDPYPQSQPPSGRSIMAYWHRVELFRADVTKVLIEPANKERDSHEERVHAARESKRGPGAKTQGIKEAISQLWPDGIPKTLLAKDRNAMIKDRFPDANHAPSVRQIQRALKDLRSK